VANKNNFIVFINLLPGSHPRFNRVPTGKWHLEILWQLSLYTKKIKLSPAVGTSSSCALGERSKEVFCTHKSSRVERYFIIKKKKIYLCIGTVLSNVFADPDKKKIQIRIRVPFFYLSRIPDPVVKKAPDPGSGSTTLLSLQTNYSPGRTCVASPMKHDQTRSSTLFSTASEM
jgi:hypothetical protein